MKLIIYKREILNSHHLVITKLSEIREKNVTSLGIIIGLETKIHYHIPKEDEEEEEEEEDIFSLSA